MVRQYHFWLVSSDEKTGRPYLIYGCPDREGESHARMLGLEKLQGLDFHIVRYPTRDLGQASAFLRGKRLNEGMGLHTSAVRQGHEKSLARLKRRQSRRL